MKERMVFVLVFLPDKSCSCTDTDRIKDNFTFGPIPSATPPLFTRFCYILYYQETSFHLGFFCFRQVNTTLCNICVSLCYLGGALNTTEVHCNLILEQIASGGGRIKESMTLSSQYLYPRPNVWRLRRQHLMLQDKIIILYIVQLNYSMSF